MPVDIHKNLEVQYAYTEAIDFGQPDEVAPDIFWVRMPLELTGLNHITVSYTHLTLPTNREV